MALPFGSSDVGNGLLANLILTRKTPTGQDLIFITGATTDTGLDVLFSKFIFKRTSGWQFDLDMGILKNPQDNYFSRGNFQNLPAIKRIQEGQQAIPTLSPTSPDVLRARSIALNENYFQKLQSRGDTQITSEDLNYGPDALRDRQNRHYRYGVNRQLMKARIKKRLGSSNLYPALGLNGVRVRIDPLGDNVDKGEVLPNASTLLELERPVGYNARERFRSTNALAPGLEYNSLPLDREGHPNQGMRSGVIYEGAGRGTGADYHFHRTTLYHHHYLELWPNRLGAEGRELVLAHRLFGSRSVGQIPFFEERGLGANLLRGYPGNQFVDRVLVGGSLELRYTAVPQFLTKNLSLGLLIFGDFGRVAANIKSLNHAGWHKAAGAGIDVIVDNRFAFELVYGSSRYENFVILQLGHTLNLRID